MRAFILLLLSVLPVLVYAAPQAKIINGQTVADNEAPWQVALISNNQQPYTSYFCSASIVGNKWLVTAAHCAERSNGKPFYAVIGTTDLLNTQKAQIIFKQKSNIGYAIAEHGNSLNTHAKSKTSIFFTIVTAGRKYFWINHACT